MLSIFLSIVLSFHPNFDPITVLETSKDRIKIKNDSSKKISLILQECIQDFHDDIEGEKIVFDPILGCDELTAGDLLFLGNSEKEVFIAGIYQSDDEWISAIRGCNSIEFHIGSFSNFFSKNSFPYVVLCRSEKRIEFTDMRKELTFWNENFTSYFINGERTPIVLTPKSSFFTLHAFQKWAKTQNWQLHSLLNQHGALLLRDFPIKDSEDFLSIITTILEKEPVDYFEEGDAQRRINSICIPMEISSECFIPLHHELSCTQDPPSYISFYCERAPEKGRGHTLLGRTQQITQEIYQQSKLWKLFEGKKIKYISRHPSRGNFFSKVNKMHKPWQEVFGTEDKEEVGRLCRENGFDFQWQGDWIIVTRLAPALREADEHFSFSYWYNQAHLYHVHARIGGGFLNRFLTNLLYIDPLTRPYDVVFEGGESISESVIGTIYDIIEKEKIGFDWQKGDILIVDNKKMLHGRSPYVGQRRIVVAVTP